MIRNFNTKRAAGRAAGAPALPAPLSGTGGSAPTPGWRRRVTATARAYSPIGFDDEVVTEEPGPCGAAGWACALMAQVEQRGGKGGCDSWHEKTPGKVGASCVPSLVTQQHFGERKAPALRRAASGPGLLGHGTGLKSSRRESCRRRRTYLPRARSCRCTVAGPLPVLKLLNTSLLSG